MRMTELRQPFGGNDTRSIADICEHICFAAVFLGDDINKL